MASNGLNLNAAMECVQQIETLDQAIEEVKREAKRSIDKHKVDQKAIYSAVESAGVPSDAVKSIVKERQILRKLHIHNAALDPRYQASRDVIKEKLGMLHDLPLGSFVLAQKDELEAAQTKQ